MNICAIGLSLPVSLTVSVSLSMSACGLIPTNAAPNRSVSDNTSQVVIINEAAFTVCPAYAPSHSLLVFNAAAWRTHIKAAVIQPNKLKTWLPDLNGSMIVRYAMGSKPTAGHGVKLAGPVTSRHGSLTVPVRLRAPKKGMVAAAVLTSPCLYLQLAGHTYKSIRILNVQDGQVLKELSP